MEQSWCDTLCPLLWGETMTQMKMWVLGIGIDWEEKLAGIC